MSDSNPMAHIFNPSLLPPRTYFGETESEPAYESTAHDEAERLVKVSGSLGIMTLTTVEDSQVAVSSTEAGILQLRHQYPNSELIPFFVVNLSENFKFGTLKERIRDYTNIYIDSFYIPEFNTYSALHLNDRGVPIEDAPDYSLRGLVVTRNKAGEVVPEEYALAQPMHHFFPFLRNLTDRTPNTAKPANVNLVDLLIASVVDAQHRLDDITVGFPQLPIVGYSKHLRVRGGSLNTVVDFGDAAGNFMSVGLPKE